VTEDGRVIRIPPTLLISGIGIVRDVERCVTMDLKRAGNLLVVVGATSGRLGGSHWRAMTAGGGATSGRTADGLDALPVVDLVAGPKTAAVVARAIAEGLVRSAHDPSEGGLLVAAAEMAFAGRLGCTIELDRVPHPSGTGGAPIPADAVAFAEDPSRYLLEVEPDSLAALERALDGIPHAVIGRVDAAPRFTLEFGGTSDSTSIDELHAAWSKGAELP